MNYNDILTTFFENKYLSFDDVWSDEGEFRELVANQIFIESQQEAGSEHKSLRILDIGTGRARDCEAIAENGHYFTGLDLIETKEWVFLKKKYPEQVSFIASRFLDWDAGELRFDLILDSGCFHHQEPEFYKSYLKRVNQLLEPDGRFLLTVFSPLDPLKSGFQIINDTGRISRYFSQDELKQLLAENNFTVKRLAYKTRKLFSGVYLSISAMKQKQNA